MKGASSDANWRQLSHDIYALLLVERRKRLSTDFIHFFYCLFFSVFFNFIILCHYVYNRRSYFPSHSLPSAFYLVHLIHYHIGSLICFYRSIALCWLFTSFYTRCSICDLPPPPLPHINPSPFSLCSLQASVTLTYSPYIS